MPDSCDIFMSSVNATAVLICPAVNGVVVYSEFNEYHLVLRLLFSYFKAPTIITKLLCSLGYYIGSFKIRK